MGALQNNGYPARFIHCHTFPQQWSTPTDPPSIIPTIHQGSLRGGKESATSFEDPGSFPPVNDTLPSFGSS